jgi:hypothetical protein
MVAAGLAELKVGANQFKGVPVGTPSQDQAAKQCKVGRRSVARAKKVLKSKDGKLIAAVKDGTVSVRAAAAVADLPDEEREATVEAGPKAIKAKARDMAGAKKGQQATKARKAAAAQPGAADSLEAVAAAFLAECAAFCKAIKPLLPRLRVHMRCEGLVPEDQHQRLGDEAGRLLEGVEAIVYHSSLKSLKRLLENKLIELKKRSEKM